ncbi:thiol:disulfide interchange protein [Prolixibacter denitrificans]|uniref:Thiol:disulfide interchange protein n=2 Tax=Prolixibacter denitrificans TaxID=1541063 RepID=A0ABQ0ZF20_9BACT|nr:thiol:disulfide interchange protein [Prolixibacter denitrificans]
MKKMNRMKKLLFLLLALAAFAACSSPDGFTIKGNIQGQDSGEVALLKYDGKQWNVEDTTKLDNGNFVLKGKTDLPELRVIRLGQKKLVSQFFAENGKINVQAYADSLDKTVVTGSKANDVFSQFTDEMKRLSSEAKDIQQRYAKARMSGDEDGMKKAQIDIEAMVDNQKVFAKNFIREHKNSTVAPFVALWQFGQNATYQDLDTLVAFFDPSIKQSIYVKELQKMADQRRVTGIGAVAPDFTMNDPDGNPFTLSSLRGKYVLLDFWASWCGPCRQENPNVVKVYNEYKDKGFTVLGVSLDRDHDAWVKAIKDDHLTWHQVSDLQYWNNKVAREYGVTSIPHSLLLDKDGKIIAKNLRGPALEQKLKEIFGE